MRRARTAFRLAPFLLCLHAQAATAHLPVRRYTSADGLAQDEIRRMAFDAEGFLWIATAGGLSRFDGAQFVGFGPADGLRGRVIHDLAIGADGTSWVATEVGLFAFRPGKSAPPGRLFEQVPLEGVPQRDHPHRLVVDGSGELWVGTLARVWRVKQTGARYRVAPVVVRPGRRGGLDSRVQSLALDPEGALWIGTHKEGIFRVARDGRVDHCTLQTYGTFFVRGFHFPGDGSVWTAFFGGVAIFERPPFGERTRPARIYAATEGMELDTTCLQPVGDDEVLVGTTAGVIEMRRTAGGGWRVGRTLDHRSGLPADSVHALARDARGTLWVGMATRGVVKLLQNGFSTFEDAEGPGSIILDLATDRAGHLVALAATGATGLTLYQPDADRPGPFRVSFPSSMGYVGWGGGQKLLLDSHGSWWIATGAGVLRYDDAGGEGGRRLERPPDRIYGTRDGLSGVDGYVLTEDPRGDVWISTGVVRPGASALSRWSRATGSIENFPASATGTRALAGRFLSTRDGSLWVLFHDGALVRAREGRLQTIARWSEESDAHEMFEDGAGRLWVLGRQVHVCDVPGAALPRFVRRDMGPEADRLELRCAVEDREGRVWFGTDHGVLHLDARTGAVGRFTIDDGLVGNSINMCARDGAGALWFSDVSGLSRLEAGPAAKVELAPARLREIRIGGEAVPLPLNGATSMGPLRVAADRRRLSIEFFAVHQGPGPPLRFQYRLESSDRDWSVPASGRSVQYAGMAPGRYRFLVRTVSEDGVASDVPASVSLNVLAPFWRQAWFLVACLFTSAGLVYVVYRNRVGRVVAMERVRTRIATDLHDDIGSSLSQIAILSQVAERERPSPSGEDDPLARITALSSELIDGMSDVVWAISPRWDTVSSLVHRMRRFASELFPEDDVTLELELPEDDEAPIDPDVRRQLYLIFKEALHNVRRHAAAEHVRVRLDRRRGRWELLVEEDGRGFDPRRASEGQGLQSMRRRAERLGGRLEVRSSPRGTRVELEIPERPSPRNLSNR